MRKRFKFPLTFIGMMILGCVTVFACYLLYFEVTSGASIMVDAPLSINYLSSEIITKENNSDVKFSVSNNGTAEEDYYIEFIGVESPEEVEYTIISDGGVDLSGVVKSAKIIERINIMPGETHNYTINVDIRNIEYFEAEIKVKKVTEEILFFADSIITNNEVKDESVTEIAKEIASIDEGLIKTNDETGDVYYFRGDTTTNYVSFADKMWRIVRINSDNSVRIILDGQISSISKYYTSDSEFGFTSSTVESTLNDWFNSNLSSYADLISTQKFCNDNSLVNSENNVLAAYNRANVDKIATYNCLGETLNLKIGLLTVDEVLFAGHTTDSDSKTYLTNENIEDDYYLMSGSYIGNSYYPFLVDTNGLIIDDTAGTLLRGVRPVVNISSGVKTTGNGSIDDPYLIQMEE